MQRQVGRSVARFRQGVMTQAELARKVGVSLEYIQRVEAN
jgi:predicted transcriptional regulator